VVEVGHRQGDRWVEREKEEKKNESRYKETNKES
jgi:hypothetical protein